MQFNEIRISWDTPYPERLVRKVEEKYGLFGADANLRVYNLWGKGLSSKLWDQTICVTDLVQRLFAPIKNNEVRVLHVKCVNRSDLVGTFAPSDGFSIAKVFYDPDPLFRIEDDLDKKRIALEITSMGLRLFQEDRGVDLGTGIAACEQAAELGLRNEWVWKSVRSEQRDSAVVSVMEDPSSYVVRLEVFSKDGRQVFSDEIYEGGPHTWFIADYCLGRAWWDGRVFRMESKWGFSYEFSLDRREGQLPRAFSTAHGECLGRTLLVRRISPARKAAELYFFQAASGDKVQLVVRNKRGLVIFDRLVADVEPDGGLLSAKRSNLLSWSGETVTASLPDGSDISVNLSDWL